MYDYGSTLLINGKTEDNFSASHLAVLTKVNATVIQKKTYSTFIFALKVHVVPPRI